MERVLECAFEVQEPGVCSKVSLHGDPAWASAPLIFRERGKMGGGGRGGSDAVDVAFAPFQGHHALGESDLTLQRRQCVVVMWVGAALWWLLVQSTVARTREWQRLDRRIVCVWGR